MAGSSSSNASNNERSLAEIPRPTFYVPQGLRDVKCKITTRCKLKDLYGNLSDQLTVEQMKWFDESQFRNILHYKMESVNNPMWTLILRMVKSRTDEAWFVLNGIPIRYSIQEHCLLSGLKAGPLPELPSRQDSFGERYFPFNAPFCLDQISLKRHATRSPEDKLKMAVLYFLAVVIAAPLKNDGPIDRTLVQAVDDLHACNDYPWGTFSFNAIMSQLHELANTSLLTKANQGAVRVQSWNLPGFFLPLMMLPFECIPALQLRFMNRTTRAPGVSRFHVWSLKNKKPPTVDDVLKVIGDSKEIRSTIEPENEEEQRLIESIHREPADCVTDAWTQLINRKRSIFWEELYREDVRTLNEDPPLAPERHHDDPPSATSSPHASQPSQPPHASQRSQPRPAPASQARSGPASHPLDDDAIRGIIREELRPLKEDISSLREDVTSLKEDISSLKRLLLSRLPRLMTPARPRFPTRQRTPQSSPAHSPEHAPGPAEFTAPGPAEFTAQGVGESSAAPQQVPTDVGGSSAAPQLLPPRPPTNVDPPRSAKRKRVTRSTSLSLNPSMSVKKRKDDLRKLLQMWYMPDQSRLTSLQAFLGEDDLRWRSASGLTYDPAWFAQWMKVGEWLEDSHMDEFLFGLRKVQMEDEVFVNPRAYIADVNFPTFIKAELNMKDSFWSEIVKHLNGEYFEGYNKSWNDVDDVYFPLCLKSLVNDVPVHWVGVRANLKKHEIVVFDSSAHMYEGEDFTKVTEFITKGLPQFLKRRNGDPGPAEEWPVRRFRNVIQNKGAGGDCGMFVLKHIEFSIMNRTIKASRKDIKDANIVHMRLKMASDAFVKGTVISRVSKQ